MIDTKEGVKKWLADRQEAQAKMRSAIKGELPLDKPVRQSNIETNGSVRQESVLGETVRPTVSEEVPTGAEVLPKKKFDKVAYQRDYMRKRRAAKKAQSR